MLINFKVTLEVKKSETDNFVFKFNWKRLHGVCFPGGICCLMLVFSSIKCQVAVFLNPFVHFMYPADKEPKDDVCERKGP